MDFNNQQNNQNFTAQQNNVQPAYNAVPPTYVPVQAANPNNGMAIASLICGIVGILSCCCCGIGFILGIVGLILAIVSKGKNGGKMSGLAIAGLICSIVAILSGVGGLFYLFAAGGMDAFIEGFYEGYYGY